MLSILLAILIFSILLGIPALASEEHDDDAATLNVKREIQKVVENIARSNRDSVELQKEYLTLINQLNDEESRTANLKYDILQLERKRIENGEKELSQAEKQLFINRDNLKQTEKLIQLQEQILKAGGEGAAEAAKELAELQKIARTQADVAANSQKAVDAQKEIGDAVASAGAKFFGLRKSAEGSLESIIFNTIASKDFGGALAALGQQMAETFGPMNLMVSVREKVVESTVKMVFATDSAISSFRRATGAGEEFNSVLMEARVDSAQAGVSMAQTAEAAGALFTGMRQFTEIGPAAKTELIAFTTTMENLGIASGATTEFMNNSTTAMGMNVDQSIAAQTELAATGIALGMAPGEMMEGFNQAFPQLAAHGAGAIEVFQGIAAAAKATGASMNTLLGVFGQAMDTFEGTAEVAGRVNAVLGNDLLNSVDLLNASEDERIRMMIEAIELSGRSFDAMGRFERRALANAAGITDMAEANRIFGTSLSVFDEQQRQARESGMSQEQLAERAAAATDVMQKFNAVIENLAILVEPIIDGLHTVVNEILELQKEAGNLFIPIALLASALTGLAFRGIGALLGKFGLLSGALKFVTGDFKGLLTQLKGGGAATEVLEEMTDAAADAGTKAPVAGVGIKKFAKAAKTAAPGIAALGTAALKLGAAIALVILSITAFVYVFGLMSEEISNSSPSKLFTLAAGMVALAAAAGVIGAIIGSGIGGAALAVGLAFMVGSVVALGLALQAIPEGKVTAFADFMSSLAQLGNLGAVIGPLASVADAVGDIAQAIEDLPVSKSIAFNTTLGQLTEFTAATTSESVNSAEALVNTIRQVTEVKLAGALGVTLMLGTLTKLVKALNAGQESAAGGGGTQRAIVLEVDKRQLGKTMIDILEDKYSLRPS